MNRGDVILVRFPHPSGVRGKKRPAVVVQADAYAGTVSTVVVAEVTRNLALAHDPACLLIDLSTPEGKATGLIQDSVVSCLLLATVDAKTVANVLGTLSPTMKQKLDGCLKAALELP
jgi:mRNA-degrading endonuclease toxin of MazEF toxin-antitoxin module